MLRSLVIKRSLSNGYQQVIFNAREDVNKLLESQDRSSYILAQYIPEPARDAFIAIRGFNLEINKIHGNKTGASTQLSSTMGLSTADMKFRFWNDILARIFTNPMNDSNIGEPIAILLRDAIRNDLNLDIGYFHRFLQTRKHFVENTSFSTTNDICSYGEGTYSQLNYLTQGLLLSPNISPSVIKLLEESTVLQSLVSDISAHIGQATAIGSMILGMNFYASQNRITLPIDLMTKYDLSQETLFRLSQGHLNDESQISEAREQLKNILYEMATTANDHILTARDKLSKATTEIKDIKNNTNDELIQKQFKNWKKGVPDVIFTPFMVGIPTVLYLNKLQKNDFDIFGKDLQKKEWRLAWTSFKNYYQRKI
ncbi:hypothetical protein CLIB1444_10S02168 [[Candida] jaroonii]|uniref:Uncharacterized protein n=1 Tax=[Candida] jaroonii TaxID=467808 RepID=A0ACA9YC09_9ASCO|nr:hypothetical protein CLIB1444_10S02168 [[Candida] jaroonii]